METGLIIHRVSKCRSLFNCESVIVPKELHVGILNDTVSRHTAAKTLKSIFQNSQRVN